MEVGIHCAACVWTCNRIQSTYNLQVDCPMRPYGFVAMGGMAVRLPATHHLHHLAIERWGGCK